MAEGTSDTRNWFLRIASGTVFGPVSTQGLVTWAEQGRAQAGNAVSTDRKTWQPAESLPELDIAWYVEDDKGELVGPFHRRVAEKLVGEGLDPGSARLVAAADADLSRLRRPASSKRSNTARTDHPELDLDPPGETAPDAGDAAPAEWIEERETLRLRIAEMEEQSQQLLRSAEKETKSLNRQIENARRQVASMERELEELRIQASAAPSASALSEAEATAAAERQALESALKEVRQENGQLRAQVAALETKQGEMDVLRQTSQTQAEALQRQAGELESLRADQSHFQAAKKDIETLKVRIAELVGQIAEKADETETLEDLRRDRAKLDEAVRAAHDEYAELLAFSNGRDHEHQQERAQAEAQRAELQSQFEAAAAALAQREAEQAEAAAHEPARIRELSARLRDQETLLAGMLTEETQAIGQILASERDAFKVLRDTSLQRQNVLQTRQAVLEKLKGGETGDVFEREAKVRIDKANSARTQEALLALQQEHGRFVRQAETRERELVSRIRILELEEERLKTRAAEAEPLFQRNQRLTELLSDREQKLAQERQQRSIEQAQLEQAHQALLSQIETVKRADEKLPLKPEAGEASAEARQPAREMFRVTPWMRLKK